MDSPIRLLLIFALLAIPLSAAQADTRACLNQALARFSLVGSVNSGIQALKAVQIEELAQDRARGSSLTTRYHAPPEYTITPVRKIDQIYPGLEPELMLELAHFDVTKIDRPLLEKDFPVVKRLTDEQVRQWLKMNLGYISVPQASQEIVNSRIELTGRYRYAYRPPTYGRAVILEIMDPFDPTRPIGLIDMKGSGKKDAPSFKSHSNGLDTLGSLTREDLVENATRWTLAHAKDTHTLTVGSYFTSYMGFQMKYPDGNEAPAGGLGRQAAQRDDYVEGNIRSAWLDGPSKAPILDHFNAYGIYTGHQANIQGFHTADGKIGLFDYAHYVFGRAPSQPALSIPFKDWGWTPEQEAQANRNGDQWSLSQMDLLWVHARETADQYKWQGGSARNFAQLFDAKMGVLATKLPIEDAPISAKDWFHDRLGLSATLPELKTVELALLNAEGLAEPMRTRLIERGLPEFGIFSPDARHRIAGSLAFAILDQRRPVQGLELTPEVYAAARIAPGFLESSLSSGDLDLSGRKQLLTYLMRRNVPHFLRKLENGSEIPVVLVNVESLPALEPFLRTTLGDQVYLLPNDHAPQNERTDHGAIHLGMLQMDFFHPSETGNGQTNETGIRHRNLWDVTRLARNGNRPVLLDVASRLTPEEYRLAEVYHRARRGGIFIVRNQFTMNNDPRNSRWRYDHRTTVLDQRTTETCYKFGAGVCARYQADLMTEYLQGLGAPDVARLLTSDSVQSYLQSAENLLMRLPLDQEPYLSSDQAQETILHDWLLRTPEHLELLRGAMPDWIAHGSEADQVRFLNYLFGVDVSRRYADLTARLGFYDPEHPELNYPDRQFVDANRPRSTAILIFDGDRGAAEKFWAATYEARGARYELKNNFRNRAIDQRPQSLNRAPQDRGPQTRKLFEKVAQRNRRPALPIRFLVIGIGKNLIEQRT